MTTAVMNPDESWAMNPETMEVLESYLLYGDVSLVANELHIPKQKVTYYLGRPESKRFLDQIYFEQGYLNRNRQRLSDILGEVMELKLEEMRESEMGSKKDIAELIALAHKIRADEAKISSLCESSAPKNQTNVQINNAAGFGDNYNSLLEKIINVEKT